MLSSTRKIAFTAKILFGPAATFMRLSLICFYYRLVRDSAITWFRTVLHISVVYTIAVGVTFVLLAVFECM